ncbi:MAG: RNA polymerase sigma factor [Gemmataceae bacterium]
MSMASDSDRLLIAQIRQGDPKAWQLLIDRYEGRLLAFAIRRLRDRAASEDVVQETFIGFLNSLPNFDDRRELQTYLFTIASHKVTDQLRRLGRKPWQSGSEDGIEILDNQRDSGQRAASSLARSGERKDLENDAVSRCLGQMLRDWQQKGDFLRIEVLELLFVKGWANCDVAIKLGITEQQVANYRFAAMRKLSDAIRDAGLSPDVFPELLEEKT